VVIVVNMDDQRGWDDISGIRTLAGLNSEPGWRVVPPYNWIARDRE